MPIRALIFDLMDVLLLVHDKSVWHAWEASAGVAESGLARTMFRSPLFPQAISGQVPEEALWRDVARTLGVAAEPGMLAAVFYSAFQINTDLVEFIRALRPRYKIAILTNTPSGMRTVITEQFHLDQEVDAIIISAEEGIRKPQPELFQRALNRLGVQPGEVIFVDDEPGYVEGARALGMQTVQFNDTAQTILAIKHLLQQQV